MGTNTLPFLFAYITHREPFFYRLLANQPLLAKQPRIRRFFQHENPFASPSVLALKALGPAAAPVTGQLAHHLGQPDPQDLVKLSLYLIGRDSIQALEQACRTNTQSRAEAAWLIAKLDDSALFGWGYGWHKSALTHKPMVNVSWAVMAGMDEQMVRTMVASLRNPNPAIRLANLDALRIYFPGSDGKPAEPALLEAMTDPDPHIARAAFEALKKIDPPVALKAGSQ